MRKISGPWRSDDWQCVTSQLRINREQDHPGFHEATIITVKTNKYKESSRLTKLQSNAQGGLFASKVQILEKNEIQRSQSWLEIYDSQDGASSQNQ